MNKLLKNENLNNLLRSLDIAEEGKQRRVYRWGTEKREKVKALGETLTVDILPIIGLLQYNTSEVNKKKLGELKQPDIEEIKNTTVPREPFTFVASKAWLEITQTKKEEKTTQRNQKPKKEYERRTDESRREKESRFQSAVETFEPGRGQSLPNTLHIPIPTFRRPAPSVRANTSTLEPFKVDQGYTTWNEDLTSQHVHKAESLFLHHLATITESLKKEEWNKEEVNRTAWGMSNIPHELKKEKKRKRQAEERKRTGNEVTIRERTKWEGLIGRGKTGSVAKEIERRSIENSDLPEEEVRKQIRGLHDSTDEKELWIPETTAGREIVRGGEQAEVEQAINKLNSNSTPSMDGITAELIKRLCSRNRNLGAHLTDTIQLCLQKSFLPEAWCQGCPLSPSLFGLYLTEPMEEAEKQGAEVWAYLDDTVIIANSQRQLEKTELSHQAHLHLIRQALFTKPIHLLSSMRITRDALVRADEMITDHIASIFEIPPDRHFLIFQPIKKGGLGMPSFVRTADTALLCTQGSIDPTLWDIDAVTEERARQRDQSGNESSFGARKVAEQILLQLTEEERKAGAKGQKELRGIFEEREKRNEINLLPTYQQNRHKVIEDGISQRWLNILPKDRYHKLNNATVVTSLDHLFLKNPLSWDIVAGVKEEEDQEEESERRQDVGRKKGKIKLKCPLCLGVV
ncbi:hypothetical protein BLNAU_24343 [Blattamonas nauphoetae]|uniref:Reverse transcriptase domain-containing protein n=1 Tax=Blattamonas nauphoetae TaxID=2049346 RepID=A0ABQ9WMQ4_9EUKA|nr:hypothetical protein BLNAU_24343 [Blattamonas nauphoetae]